MPMPKSGEFTSADYWNLPEGVRAELIDGVLYDMAPPSWEHQKIVAGLVRRLGNHVETNGGPCQVVGAPIAVNLCADDSTWVEPDVIVVCDPEKVSARGCEGAPDFVAEVVSPSSVTMDYFTKAARYQRAGVREYWIVDPAARQTSVYRYQDGPNLLACYPFDAAVPVGVFKGLAITVAELV